MWSSTLLGENGRPSKSLALISSLQSYLRGQWIYWAPDMPGIVTVSFSIGPSMSVD